MSARPWLVAALLLAFAASSAAQSSEASDRALDDHVRALTNGMRCPCNCTMALDVCECNDHPGEPWKSAFVIKNEIRKWIGEGQSDDQIRELLVEKAGESILQAPRAQGFNLVLYLGIPAFVLAGLGVVVVTARRLTARPALAAATAPTSDAPARDPLVERYRARIEEELRSQWHS
jgi:cytochrome c-type biogenesis protein CcmH/NrfF